MLRFFEFGGRKQVAHMSEMDETGTISTGPKMLLNRVCGCDK